MINFHLTNQCTCTCMWESLHFEEFHGVHCLHVHSHHVSPIAFASQIVNENAFIHPLFFSKLVLKKLYWPQ